MIDIKKFEEEYGLTKEDLFGLLDQFQQNLSDALPELKSKLANLDFVNLSLVAHRHKSPAASLGLTELNKLLASIELNAKSEQNTELLNNQIEALEQQLFDLTPLIEALKKA